jgi:Subtilase family/PKD-like domain
VTLRSFLSRLLISARKLSLAFLSVVLGLLGQDAMAQGLSDQAVKQIQAFAADKEARTPAQRKIGSNLILASRMYRGLPAVQGVPTVQTGVAVDAVGGTVVDIRANVDDALLERIHDLGGEVLDYHIPFRSIRARVPLAALETLAADPKVIFIAPKQEARTNRVAAPDLPAPSAPRSAAAAGFSGRAARVRSQLSGGAGRKALVVNTSEGVVTHRADLAHYTFGAAGAGVKVGVLSDGVDSLATLTASGDLPTVTVLPGQAGSGNEGTAMLEIVHEVAPAAQLYFATAFNSLESFASNILALRAAGCDIIVDDVSYFLESPFQKGQAPSVVSTYDSALITQAVNDVTASGALYFSSSANSGNKTDGTSGTWEGDYVDGGAAGGALLHAGNVHDFGGGTLYDTYTAESDIGLLFWSDPLGASTNDYDLYALNAAGTSVIVASYDTQDGTQDPVEGFVLAPGTLPVGSRLVIVKYAGVGRFLHLDTERGELSINTAGNTHGHNAPPGPNAFGVAATPAAAAFGPGYPVGPYPNPFNSSNLVELFSSDGLRRYFFNPDGSAITPGNVSSTGGQVVQQPLITAADGVSSATPGFSPFYGTSAAAPHVAAIAALVKGAKPSLTATQISGILTSTAIDIMAPGVDRDSGYGIADAYAAVAATGATAAAGLYVGTTTVGESGGNGNGIVEPGECATLQVQLKDGSASVGATVVSAVLTTTTAGITVEAPVATYADIPALGSATNTLPFLFATAKTGLACPLTVDFTLTVTYAGGPSPAVIPFRVVLFSRTIASTTVLDATAPVVPAGATATATGTQNTRLSRTNVSSACGGSKAYPGLLGGTGTRQYDAYTFTNCSSTSRCVNVTVNQSGVALFSAAYLTSYDPTNLATNYLADAGGSTTSMTYSFDVAAGATFVVVVNEVNVGGGTGQSYTLNVDGLCTACGTYTTVFSCCPTITLPATTLPAGTVGTAYPPTTLTPTGGVAPYTFTVSGLAPGMTATPTATSVTIGGTPTAPFSGTVIVTAIDANGCRTNRGYGLSVVCPPPLTLAVNAPSTVGAGSPNRIASTPAVVGATYAWTITNGVITGGQGTNQITFTAGTAGTLLTLDVSVTVGLCTFGNGHADVTVVPVGSALQFYTLTPCRLVDTRNANAPLGGPALAAAGSPDRAFTLTGTCGIPAGAVAVSANLTVVSPSAGGELAVYRGDGALTGTSTISFNAGKSRADNAILQLALDGSGTVKVNNSAAGTVHLLLDVNGYFQ